MAVSAGREAAEDLALGALEWLAEDPDRLAGFLAASGARAEDLREAGRRPEFLGFVLDHLMADEGTARDFAESRGVSAETLMRGRAALPGGDSPHWT